jgi:hypothetical protein
VFQSFENFVRGTGFGPSVLVTWILSYLCAQQDLLKIDLFHGLQCCTGSKRELQLGVKLDKDAQPQWFHYTTMLALSLLYLDLIVLATGRGQHV